ncbi:uncharacterized protein [Argopecten irradians]|uniref:uncharacterized protein n=1 Tax=Argopecten irradians TaxID=31199 RepID=UPI0037140C55
MALLKKDTLKQDLERFPSTFEFDTSNLSKDRVESLIKKLNDDRENTTKPAEENLQIRNFLSYLYCLLKNHKKSIELLNESLVMDPDNIIANANKARILLEHGDISDVDVIITRLKELEQRDDFEMRKCHAEADLAYAYSRSGPWYHQQAIELYNKLVKVCPKEYTWHFGLGLTLLRRTNQFHTKADDKHEEVAMEAAKRLLTATKSENTVLCATAYAELGRALYILRTRYYCNKKTLPSEIKHIGKIDCFSKALEISPRDPFVLQVCGQYARYGNKLDESENLLRQSLEIRPTCHAYHHLALTLKRKVENTEGKIEKRRLVQDCRHEAHNERERKKHNLRAMMKSPLKVSTHPGNELLINAVKLIDKAEELNSSALNMQYDKGILYRMLGQPDNAIEVFKQIISNRKRLPNKMLLTIVYEQLGLCLLELSKATETSPDEQAKYHKDGQAYLSYAVQLQSTIVANHPLFKEAWNAYPTLKELFSDERDEKPKQLAVLHMLMGDHKDAITIYQKLLSTGNDKMEPNDCKNMLECQLKDEKFEECVTLLTSWECTTVHASLPRSMIFDVYINGAFHAYSTNNVQLAYQHFRRAFQVYGMFERAYDGSSEDDEGEKQILILHSCSEDMPCSLAETLGTVIASHTGLRYTFNTDDFLGNEMTVSSMTSRIQRTPCVIIMTHDSADLSDEDQKYANCAVQTNSEKAKPKLLAVSDERCNVPDIARILPFIQIPPDQLPEDRLREHLSEKQKGWVREFINLLKPGTTNQHQ